MLTMRKTKQPPKRGDRKPGAGSRRTPVQALRPKTAHASEITREPPQPATVTIDSLRASLDACLRRVRQGESFVIVDRDEPVALLLPPLAIGTASARAALDRMSARGLVTPGRGGPLAWFEPLRITKNGLRTSEVILREREERDLALL